MPTLVFRSAAAQVISAQPRRLVDLRRFQRFAGTALELVVIASVTTMRFPALSLGGHTAPPTSVAAAARGPAELAQSADWWNQLAWRGGGWERP